MRAWSAIFLFALFLSMPVDYARAQDLPEDQIEQLSKLAHDGMKDAKINTGVIGAETANTLVYPLAPYEDRKETVLRGYLSGFASWCDLDWKDEFFLPYMKSVRAKHPDWNQYQMAYIGVLHGLTMELGKRSKEGKSCTQADRDKIAVHALH